MSRGQIKKLSSREAGNFRTCQAIQKPQSEVLPIESEAGKISVGEKIPSRRNCCRTPMHTNGRTTSALPKCWRSP